MRYLCTTYKSLHVFFTKMYPSGGTEHDSFELFFGINNRGLGKPEARKHTEVWPRKLLYEESSGPKGETIFVSPLFG